MKFIIHKYKTKIMISKINLKQMNKQYKNLFRTLIANRMKYKSLINKLILLTMISIAK